MSRHLQKVALESASTNPGPPPKIDWLSLSKLVIDDAYQREVGARGLKNIQRIAAEFKWSRFSPVMVASVGSGQYAIIDGQHRCTAALSLGYEKVPCCIVYAEPGEAASIFASINGNVTSLSLLQVFRAARAAKEPWAIEVDQACSKAGVTALTHQTQSSLQKPCETMAIDALRASLKRFGMDTVVAALRGLVSSIDGKKPGLLNAKRIKSMAYMIHLHPGWLQDVQGLCDAFAVHNFWVNDMVNIEAAIARKLGDGRAAGVAWAEIVGRVRELHLRKFKSSMIAGITHLPHAQVERALSEIRGEAIAGEP
jgi:ParB-like nuclease domain